MEVGEEGDYIAVTTQNDSCITMGSDESHFNLSFLVRENITVKTVSTDHNFDEKGEPKRLRTEVRLLTSLIARPNRLVSK